MASEQFLNGNRVVGAKSYIPVALFAVAILCGPDDSHSNGFVNAGFGGGLVGLVASLAKRSERGSSSWTKFRRNDKWVSELFSRAGASIALFGICYSFSSIVVELYYGREGEVTAITLADMIVSATAAFFILKGARKATSASAIFEARGGLARKSNL